MMEKTKDLSNSEGANHDDRDLSEELESLYRRVARLDQPDAPAENVENGDAHGDNQDFRNLRKSTAANQNPPNPEELMERLMAIQDAYERLLTYWPFAQERPSRSPEASPEISMRNTPPEGK
jgi:hypothetical protein